MYGNTTALDHVVNGPAPNDKSRKTGISLKEDYRIGKDF